MVLRTAYTSYYITIQNIFENYFVVKLENVVVIDEN